MADGIGGLFAGGQGIALQLLAWQVLGQILSAVMGPITEGVQQQVFKVLSDVPLSPADCADAVVRGWMTQQQATDEAVLSGMNADRFQILANINGEPPGMDQVLLAFRRGYLPWSSDVGDVSVETAIKQSRLRDEWADTIRQLQFIPVPVSDAVDAVVEGQITLAEGQQYAYYGGISNDDFQVLVNTRGRPPAPEQLLTLYRRGEIPMDGTGPDVLSVQQGIYEGATKDKWWQKVAELATTYPPPRTVMAMLRAAAIDDAQATQLMQLAGLDPDSISAYIAEAHSTKVAGAKNLAESQILTLYSDAVITQDQATQLLEALGYTPDEVTYLLDIQEVSRTLRVMNAAVSKIGTLYVARKIGTSTASAQLDALQLAPDHRDQLLQLWTIERDSAVKVLTAAELVDALYYGVVDQPTAQSGLESLGYSAYDAWVLLSVRMHAPQGSPPDTAGTVTGQAP